MISEEQSIDQPLICIHKIQPTLQQLIDKSSGDCCEQCGEKPDYLDRCGCDY
jgi:hypothetical protein